MGDDVTDGARDRSGVGESFGRYELRSLLGVGGMGEVWRAHDPRHDRDVALKRMSGSRPSDEFRDRFLREARLTARLNSMHVIPLHDFGEVDGRLYLDMRLVEGSDLEKVIAAAPDGLGPARAVAIVEQVADALDSAHAAHLVHRDVKPSNVLLTESRGRDFCYLVDFGIAKAADDTAITHTGMLIGTMAYLAPELFLGHDASPRSDVYALGCVLFEALTGRRAVPGSDTPVVMHGHLHGPVPRTGRTGLAALDAVLARALAKDPADRYARAGDLARAASAALTHPGPTVEVHPAPTWGWGTPPPAPAPAAFGPTGAPAHGPAWASGGMSVPPGYRPAPPPAGPSSGPFGAVAPTRRRRRWPWVAGVAALVAVLAAAGVLAAVSSGTGTQGPGSGGPPAAVAAPRPSTLAVRPLPVRIDHATEFALTPDGRRAYVAATGTAQAPGQGLDVVDLPSGERVSSIPLGGQSEAVVLSPDGRTLYSGVEAGAATDSIAVIDVATATVTATVPVGQHPTGLGLTPDGATLVVANQGYSDIPSSAVSIIDTRSRAVTRTVTTANGPGDVAVSPDGRTAYVADSGDAKNGGTTVTLVDLTTGAVLGAVPVDFGPSDIALSPDGRTAYVGASGADAGSAGALDVVDTATRTVRTAIRAGPFAPYGVAISPDGSRVVAVTSERPEFGIPPSILVLDTATNRIVASAPFDTGGDSVRFAPDGRQAYATTDTGLRVVDVP